MKSRKEISFTSSIPPWIFIPNNVSIFPFLRKYNNPKLSKKQLFELSKNELEAFGYEFWTDGSVKKNGLGGSSCISYKSPSIYPLNVCILKPEGRLCCSYDTEIGGIHSALKHIIENETIYKMKTIFIRSDSQSILLRLKKSPVGKHRYLDLDTSILWNLII